jgi:hypothetical protein
VGGPKPGCCRFHVTLDGEQGWIYRDERNADLLVGLHD